MEPSQKKSPARHCRSCGRDEPRRGRKKQSLAAVTYQVVVACASCRTVFTALSRN